MARLEQKVAVVTGGGKGIGRGITEAFLAEGAHVVIAQRSEPNCDAALWIPTDMREAGQLSALIGTVAEHFEGIDVLVNNAGIMAECKVEDMPESDWDELMAVNLKAPFLLTKYALPLMRQRGGGSIINIGSIEGLGANPDHAAYCASKAGLHGMTAAIAVDHGSEGIRCNAIAPGWIRSEMTDDYLRTMPDAERVGRELLRMHPMGRLGEPRDVAAMAVWLASDESDFVTGQVFVVDGGRTRKLPLPII